MSTIQRYINLGAVVVPFLGFLLAIVLLWNRAIGAIELSVFVFMYIITGLIWGGFVRIFLQHHVTWSVNSVCHFFGKRRFDVEDHSTNVFWLAIPSFGESWHHNHHAFPRSAAHGLKWYEIDPSQMIIGAMKRVGLAWDVVVITPERQASKLIGAEKPAKKAKPAEEEKVAEPVG